MAYPQGSAAQTAPARVVHSYFCDEDADIIVRSSDGVEFKLYKVILSKSSPFFKDMFSLPQSPSVIDDRPSDFLDGVPVVDFVEHNRTLDHLFRVCYPCSNPEMETLDDVHALLEVANKYQLEDAAAYARKSWHTLAVSDPLRAFAIACSRRWEQEACSAALLSLKEPVWPLTPPMAPEFKAISGDTVIRLMSYQRQCGEVAKQAALNPERINRIFDWSSCRHCIGPYSMTQTRRIRDWLALYTKQLAPLLEKQPSGHTATERKLVDSSIKKVFETPPCEVEMHCIERIRQIVQQFSDEVDSVVAQVSLELDL
ncbi:hypothetical protein PsYK624_088330 [Phanerochaete sordida]|uniref:BTB domain-containing protein n=1 Tax=Phanerochaete sordida TaxID=48140 RepID=A0A9P3GD35_9APHY|nr:hypothetical protein PsYK624_088330 [Phanerochaete sordida]